MSTPRTPFPHVTPFRHPPHEDTTPGYFWQGPNAQAADPEPGKAKKAKKK